MSNLDQSISEWRQRMRATGFNEEDLLDELECHLRDDMEHLMNKGTAASQAFEEAARRLGAGLDLHREFQNANLNRTMKLTEAQKQTLRHFLVIIAVLAFGTGLFLPVIHKWRVHDPLPTLDVTIFTIGVAMFAVGAWYGVLAIVDVLKKRPKA